MQRSHLQHNEDSFIQGVTNLFCVPPNEQAEVLPNKIIMAINTSCPRDAETATPFDLLLQPFRFITILTEMELGRISNLPSCW